MSETKSAEDALLEANKELNQAHYERGQLEHMIEVEQERVDGMKLKLHNMKVDFKKIRERYTKALESHSKAQASATKPPAAPEADLLGGAV